MCKTKTQPVITTALTQLVSGVKLGERIFTVRRQADISLDACSMAGGDFPTPSSTVFKTLREHEGLPFLSCFDCNHMQHYTLAVTSEYAATPKSYFTKQCPTNNGRKQSLCSFNQSIFLPSFPLKPGRARSPHCCPPLTPHHSLAMWSFSSPFNTLCFIITITTAGRMLPNLNRGSNASTYCHHR